MRRMADTSLEAYTNIKSTLTTRQQEVYKTLLELGTATSIEIAEKLKKPLNAISGRITELMDLGLVEVIGKTKINNSSYRILKAKSNI